MYRWSNANAHVLHVLIASAAIVFAGCGGNAPTKRTGRTDAIAPSVYASPEVVGKIEARDINESSGLAASGCQPEVLWTHNDAGDNEYIFGVGTDGRHLGTWKVQNARNIDWEDIALFKDAAGNCFLLIGDIGNNKEDRSQMVIYKIAEPQVTPASASSNSRQPIETRPAETMKFRYADQPHNAETMIVHPRTGDIYILTKREEGASQIHKLSSAFGADTITMTEKIGELSLPSIPVGLLTGGSISPDGMRVILCDYQEGFELVLPADATDFDVIWKQQPVAVDLGKRRQGEGVSYSADGLSIYASSENKNAPLIHLRRRS